MVETRQAEAIAPESRQLWLVGGTRESVALAEAIALLNIACLVTVVTPAAICQYPTGQKLQVQAVKLHPHTVSQFLQQAKIAAILDASHPFATAVSQLAIAAAEAARIPYLRYERPQLEAVYGDSIESLETLLSGSLLYQQRVLLTLGYRWLHHFTPWQSKATLFARILPSLEALEAAIAAGFSPERIIALRPPISAELEAALWQQWQISQVVTKASGAAGGEAIKQQVAQQLGVQLITIRRPAIAYPHQTSHLSTALAFCQQSVSRLC